MKISVENHVSTIFQCTESELDWIRRYLSITVPLFRKNYATGRMERTGFQNICYVKRNMTFPTGFVYLLRKGARKENPPINLEFVDNRIKPEQEPVEADISYLRYYQKEAVERILKRKRGIIHHPTGSGKTVLAVALTQCVPIQWMFLVNSKDLLHQTARKYKEITNNKAGMIGDGIYELNNESNLLVATAQTLNSKRHEEEVWNLIQSVEGLIVDETHQLPANTLFRVAASAKSAYYKIGLSGTPFDRSDRKGMLTIGAVAPTIHRVKADELVKAGFLSEPHIEMHKCEQYSGKPTYQGAYGELIVRSTRRNKLLTDLAINIEKPCLVFVTQIRQGKLLTERIENAGLNVEFIWGKVKTKQREAALERLVRGDIDCIVCSVVFVHGIDIPELRGIVIGSGGKSVIQTLQRLGRGMRVTDSKSKFYVKDIYDRGCKWTQRHANERAKSYRREGHKVHIIEER